MSHYLRVREEKSQHEKLPPFTWLSIACSGSSFLWGWGHSLCVPAASAPSTVSDRLYGTRAEEMFCS